MSAANVDNAMKSKAGAGRLIGARNASINHFIYMLPLATASDARGSIGTAQLPGSRAFKGLRRPVGRGGDFFLE